MLQVPFGEILLEPTHNGVTKPKAIRGHGVKMIAMGEIFAHSRIGSIEMDRVPVTEKERENYAVQKNDLLFARQSLVLEGAGKCSIVTAVREDTVFESHLIRVRIDHRKANPYFFYYYFNSYIGKENIKTIVEQVAAAGIRGSDLVKLIVPCPPLGVQNQVVSILDSIDRKIELNNEINDNLQQQATALFNNLYHKADTKVGFTKIVQILGGGTPKTGENSYWSGVIPFFTPKDIGAPYTLYTEKTISEEGLAHCNSRLYPTNTVFVTARGTVGKVGIAGVPMAMNQSCYALVGKETNQLLVYFYTLMVVDRLKHKASGAVFDAITTRDFEAEKVSLLSSSAAHTFLSYAEPVFKLILYNTYENQRLTLLRDALLPKLMFGTIELSNTDV